MQPHVQGFGQARQTQMSESCLQTIVHGAYSWLKRGTRGTTLEESGETESGSAEEQPDEG